MLAGFLTLGPAPRAQAQAPEPSQDAVVEPGPASPGPAVGGQGTDLRLPRTTQVNLLLLQEISSKVARPDDFFDLQVMDPVQVPGGIAVPAGAKAVGQVIDAQKAGIFGSPAKLNITVRYMEAAGQQVPLRLYRPARGADKTTGGAVAGI